ncbi:MAG TPA: hypothetical protein VM582_08350 [Candidatus Thermoplasmatota archaeon]|nr:hypothetical protein [Candidatus Thermoplasmatota archaeon]
MSRPTVLVLLLSLLAAGCVAPASDVETQSDGSAAVPADWWVDAIPSSLTHPDHDHGLRAHHAGITTPNFEVVGWDPLVTAHYGTTLEGMGCGGAVTRDDGRRLAIVHSISTDVSFVVADVTDPAAPKMVGEFYMPNAVVWDADISADGNHVLVGAYPWFILGERIPELPVGARAAPVDAPMQILYRNACTNGQFVSLAGPEAYLPYGPGIVMVGIQDPAAPKLEDWVPQPVIGPHSVGSQLVGGKLYATASVTNLVHSASYYSIFEIVGSKLVPYTVIRVPGTTTRFNGHVDVFLHEHPVTGNVLAHLANWDGYYVYDITTPVPVPVSSWFDAGAVHTTYPFPSLVDEKQYIVVGQEVGEPSELPSGWVYILDITNPAAPAEVGRWTLPVKPKWDNGGLQFSPHYVAILNQTMFVSNYHGGLWAVDITDLAAPAAIGVFMPERESPAHFGGAQSYEPVIEDVIVDQTTGLLTTWDGAGGVYVLRFREDMAKVHAPRWVA